MAETKTCPYCAEEIRAEAILCRHCRSRLEWFDDASWHRDHAGRRFAGVAAAVSHAFSLPVTLVRVGFVLLTLFHLIGAILYVALWLVIPERKGEPSLLETALHRALEWLRGSRGPGPRNGGHGEDRNQPASHLC